MGDDSNATKLRPLDSLDLDFLQRQYKEFLSLVGKSDDQKRKVIERLLDREDAHRKARNIRQR